MRTEDDEELLGAERTSMIVVVLILLGLMLTPDLFGCGPGGGGDRGGDRVDPPSTPDTVTEQRASAGDASRT